MARCPNCKGWVDRKDEHTGYNRYSDYAAHLVYYCDSDKEPMTTEQAREHAAKVRSAFYQMFEEYKEYVRDSSSYWIADKLLKRTINDGLDKRRDELERLLESGLRELENAAIQP